jgi:hypothetical protein
VEAGNPYGVPLSLSSVRPVLSLATFFALAGWRAGRMAGWQDGRRVGLGSLGW